MGDWTRNTIKIPPIPAWQLVSWTLGVTAVIGGFWLLIRFQHVLLLLLTAVILSTAIQPGVAQLEKRGIARPIGVLAIFSTVGLLLSLLIWYSLPVLVEQGAAMRHSLVEGYQLLRESLQQLPNILVGRLLLVLPPTLPLVGGAADINSSSLVAADGAEQAHHLLLGLVQLAAVAMMTFFWTLEGTRLKHAAFLLVPLPKRDEVRQLVTAIETKVSAYLIGQGVLCLIIGALAFIAYLLIGLPHALLLAIFAGLLEAVPILGPFLGAIPAMIIGLSISPMTALWVLLATGIIQQLENSLLVPRVMNETIGVRPLVTLLALLGFGSLYGVLGALIALPLAAVIQLLLDRFLLARESLQKGAYGRGRLGVLRYETNQLVQDVRSQVRRKPDVPSAATDALEDELEAIALDLESFLVTHDEAWQ
ncbi:MAG: AI-2E family transporter [Anaerolineales bacterium]|nr:AI-2E family transporter [Anaerolineales bacterium]